MGYILSLESYVTAPFGRLLLPARKDILYGQEEIDLTTFIDKVKKYTEIKELTPEIVNELIDKIYVYQQIDIHYAGVGIIDIPLNGYELENAFQKSIKNIKTA